MWLASTGQEFCKDCQTARASSLGNTALERRVNARHVTSDLLPHIQNADELKYGAANSFFKKKKILLVLGYFSPIFVPR